jgi:peptidoglycan/LPS O-acetylase OafA/YrhL
MAAVYLGLTAIFDLIDGSAWGLVFGAGSVIAVACAIAASRRNQALQVIAVAASAFLGLVGLAGVISVDEVLGPDFPRQWTLMFPTVASGLAAAALTFHLARTRGRRDELRNPG